MVRRFGATAVLAATVGLCAGCGSTAPPSLDPAAAVPAAAPFYLEATIQPPPAERHAVSVVGSRLLGDGRPLARLQSLLRFGGRAPKGGQLSQLIGRKVGLYLAELPALEERNGSPQRLLAQLRAAFGGSPFAKAGTPPGAVVFDAANAPALRAYLRSAGGRQARSLGFLGARLTALPNGEAGTVFRGYLVIGNLFGVERSVEALVDGRSLRGAAAFGRLRTTAPPALVDAYLLLPNPAPSAPGGPRREPPGYLQRLIGPPGTAAYLALSVTTGQLRLEVDRYPLASDPPTAQETETAAATAELLAGLPETAWLALALENLPDGIHKSELAAPLISELLSLPKPPNPTLTGLLEAAGAAFGGVLSGLTNPLSQVVRALEGHGGALAAALQGWLGPAALYIAGSALTELNGGLVVAARSEGAAKKAVGRLGSILSESGYNVRPDPQSPVSPAISLPLNGLPGGLQVAAGDGRFVAGLGADPLQSTFSPQGTLGASATFRQAVAQLGEGFSPRAYLAFPQLTAVLGLLGANGNPATAGLLQRLYALSTLAIGVARSGPVLRTAAAIALSP